MNPISWFEVPVSDMDRAIKFYNAVMGWDLKVFAGEGITMAWFPAEFDKYGAAGSLALSEHYTPSTQGVLVYFKCEDVNDTLALIHDAGGKVIFEKKLISPDVGYMGAAIDSEGNRIAFHSEK
jgi:predicted enzyme related to lactoylglutathione lyase